MTRKYDDHEHHWHVYRGPYLGQRKDGHEVQKCCHCYETRLVPKVEK